MGFAIPYWMLALLVVVVIAVWFFLTQRKD